MWNRTHQPFMIVLSSPSGAGKTTICREIVKRDKKIFYSVSATTRPPRKGEINGKSYLFVSETQFRQMILRNELLEYAEVYNHLYGTPKTPVIKAFRTGKDVIADLDIQGMRSCKQKLPGTVSIFILPPSIKELQRRLARRGTEKDEELQQRREALEKELACIHEFDYLVINDKLEKAIRDVLGIIRSERLRTGRKIHHKKRRIE
uniref:Guanylate kinase n=1 Tax=candidate division WOR-3 bacterium TaxID=2052148 RepID=A0A7C3IY28_UNCW3